jgi:hypothetical protein
VANVVKHIIGEGAVGFAASAGRRQHRLRGSLV